MQRAVGVLQHLKPRFEQAYPLVQAVHRGSARPGRAERGRKRATDPASKAHALGLCGRLYHLARRGIDAADHPSIVGNDTTSFAESL